jgi:lysophospholipase L1-like esterase
MIAVGLLTQTPLPLLPLEMPSPSILPPLPPCSQDEDPVDLPSPTVCALGIDSVRPEFSPRRSPSRSPLALQATLADTSQWMAAAQVPEQPAVRPSSGPQMYVQRRTALQVGQTYTRLPVDEFQDRWEHATHQPTYEDWVDLLNQEAQAMARGQGNNRLTVMVGDSLSLWFPTEHLSRDRFWLNQGISGDTSAGVLRRLSSFAQTRPDRIHVMVGINDLRRGASDTEILTHIHTIMQRLRHQHPDAEIIVHSILPTRLPALPSDRIQALNRDIARLAQQEQVGYLDLQVYFTDAAGVLHRELTTDGIHLSRRGYAVWRLALQQFNLA